MRTFWEGRAVHSAGSQRAGQGDQADFFLCVGGEGKVMIFFLMRSRRKKKKLTAILMMSFLLLLLRNFSLSLCLPLCITFRRPVKPGVHPRRQGPRDPAGPELSGGVRRGPAQRGRCLLGPGDGELHHCVGHAAEDPGRERRRRRLRLRWSRRWL